MKKKLSVIIAGVLLGLFSGVTDGMNPVAGQNLGSAGRALVPYNATATMMFRSAVRLPSSFVISSVTRY